MSKVKMISVQMETAVIHDEEGRPYAAVRLGPLEDDNEAQAFANLLNQYVTQGLDGAGGRPKDQTLN